MRILRWSCGVICALASSFGGALAAAPHADLILTHGRIYTVAGDPAWVQAVAIRDGRFIAVGTDAEVLKLKSSATKVIDLQGRLLTPGFIDSHVHVIDGGRYLRNVPLRDATSMADVRQRLARYAKAHPGHGWIQGQGWSYGYPDLAGGEFRKELLDSVSADRPIFLDSSMAHAAWANSAALRLAGISRDTPDPVNGQIVHTAGGEPTGWLKEEAAIQLVQRVIPPATAQEDEAALLAAIREANRLGITRLDSAGDDYPMLELLSKLDRQGKLTLHFSVADWINPPGLTAAHLAALEAARARFHSRYLNCCVAKFIMDGVIESHTAYLPGGYADKPGVTGMRFFEPAAYKEAVRTLNAHGFQVYTHAIGDGAIKLALDAYSDSSAAAPGSDYRNRIEHAEAPDPEDIARFGRLGVIASMQPLMIYPRDEWKGMEGLWAQYAGEKFLPDAFAIHSLLESNATVAFGTDWPVVQLNPLLGMRNAVLRQSLDGQPAGGYVPEQRISIEAALRAYTLSAAYASRAEQDEGSITVGKWADAVVFSQNFLDSSPDSLPTTTVVMTLVGGRIVYPSGAARADKARRKPAHQPPSIDKH